MINGSKFTILLEDLYNRGSFYSYVIKNKYYYYIVGEQKCDFYSEACFHSNETNSIPCSSPEQFIELLNKEMQKTHFNEKFDEMLK